MTEEEKKEYQKQYRKANKEKLKEKKINSKTIYIHNNINILIVDYIFSNYRKTKSTQNSYYKRYIYLLNLIYLNSKNNEEHMLSTKYLSELFTLSSKAFNKIKNFFIDNNIIYKTSGYIVGLKSEGYKINKIYLKTKWLELDVKDEYLKKIKIKEKELQIGFSKRDLNKYKKEFYKENKVFLDEHSKKWKKENGYITNRLKNDQLYKLSTKIRASIKNSIKKKGFTKKSKTHDILGCSFEEFKLYLESKFESWMSWENYGNQNSNILEFNKSWDLDHIVPISIATTEEEVIKLNHYLNFQPLCSKINREIKRDRLDFQK